MNRSVKFIDSQADLENFKNSATYIEILEFIKVCGDAIIGVEYSPTDTVTSVVVAKIQQFMNMLYDLVDEIPPSQQPMRFGNKAFRQWHKRLVEVCETCYDS